MRVDDITVVGRSAIRKSRNSVGCCQTSLFESARDSVFPPVNIVATLATETIATLDASSRFAFRGDSDTQMYPSAFSERVSSTAASPGTIRNPSVCNPVSSVARIASTSAGPSDEIFLTSSETVREGFTAAAIFSASTFTPSFQATGNAGEVTPCSNCGDDAPGACPRTVRPSMKEKIRTTTGRKTYLREAPSRGV